MLNSQAITSKPKQLFLLDGVGACLTAFLLVVVVARFDDFFGMPRGVVFCLSGVASVFAVCSLGSYFFVNDAWRLFLKRIAIANLLYCCLTLGLTVAYWQRLTGWGISYFLLEIVVVSSLAAVELKAVELMKTAP